MYLNARRGLAIVASAALLAVAAACTSGGNTPSAQPSDPGVTSTTILVGSHQPLTGPAAAGYSKIAPATKAYFDYINKHGGVNGRQITYKYVDDMYNPTTTNTVVRQLVEQEHVFAILNGLGTPTHTGVLPYLKQQHVPDLFVASGSLSWNQPTTYPNTFGYQTDYTTEGKILGKYVATTWPGKKVCFFGQGDDFGTDSLNGIEKGLGAPVTAKQTYDVTQQNVGPQISQLKGAGCEIVTTATIPGFTAIAMGTAAAIGFKPQWVVGGVGGDYNTLKGYLKDASPLIEGMITDGYLPAVTDTSNPWIQYFMKINADFNGGATFDGNVEYGMSVGWLFVEALRKAGPNLTRQGLIDAVESGGFTGGPGLVPLLFSKTSHAGFGGVQLSKVTNGVQAYFGTPYVTDAGDGAVQAYNGTPANPPTYQGAS
jgi:ABC-type branched-subunit amino acid transport system substrate-binding protein